MRKMKSLSSLKKRIRRSAGGKFVHRRSGTSHNNACKSKRRKRRLHTPAAASGGLHRRVRQLVPYI
jgi:large subunit ribosomal protein L35